MHRTRYAHRCAQTTRRVYKELVNIINNKYFHTYPKLHTVRPFLHNKVCKTATTLLRVEYTASIPGLFYAIQGFQKEANFARGVWDGVTGWLLHKNFLLRGEYSIQIWVCFVADNFAAGIFLGAKNPF